ncbi:MAG: tRNA cytidylyltransferase [Anaeromyxobacteraceae bacterium]|nr:tRNA cytidylyltransferase [Anaeromyxobacteraceae bacterium]
MPLPAPLRDAVVPAEILAVLRRLGEAGHRSWLVGGAVRDLLLGRPHGDFDLATPATPQQVMALFPRVVPTGLAHGTVTVLVDKAHKVEVTTFRGEGAYRDGRRPESVTFHTDLVEDLARRDFTVNALAFDPLAGELADPHGGQDDLSARVIRAVGDPAARFGEDGLRALRAVRFAAQLGFALDPATLAAIRPALEVVRKVSMERVGEELARLSAAPHVAPALELLFETGLAEVVVAPFAAASPAARRHAGLVAAALAPGEGRPWRRLAAILHVVPVGEVEPLLAGLRFPRRVVEAAAALAARHACLLDGPPEDPHAPAPVRRWLSGVGRERLGDLLDLRDAEVAALPAAERAPLAEGAAALRRHAGEVEASRAPLTTGDLALDGRALMALLGCGPGPHVGEGLRALLDEVLDDPALNTPERLEALARGWWAARPL